MIKIRDLKFEYFDRDDSGNLTDMVKALGGFNFDAKKGDFIGIAGRNGSGKSTLAKILNRLIVPIEGTVIIDGLDALDAENMISIRKKTGMVFQNPDEQLVGSVVSEDVAFGAENLGVPHEQLWNRVINALEAVGLDMYADKRICELSGGEKQKTAVAGVLAMEPECIVFDEASSMLDPESRDELLKVILELNRTKGITIIMITHNMEELFYADMIYIMDKGRAALKGTPRQIFASEEKLGELGLQCPEIIRIGHRLAEEGIITNRLHTAISEIIKELLESYPYAFKPNIHPEKIAVQRHKVNPVSAILLSDITFRYGKDFEMQGLNLEISKGSFTAIVGESGAGKTTLLQLLGGLIKPSSGRIYIDGKEIWEKGYKSIKLRQKLGYIFQYPEEQLFAANVFEDVIYGVRNLGVGEVEAEKSTYEAIKMTGLPDDVYDMKPYKLSGGQKRRAAMAGVLAMKPEYLLLDEPTAGLDPEGKREIMEIIDAMHKQAGMTIIMVTHDIEAAAEYASDIIELEAENKGELKIGCIKQSGSPEEIFCKMALENKNKRTPAITSLLAGLRENGMAVNTGIVKMNDGIDEICRIIRSFRI